MISPRPSRVRTTESTFTARIDAIDEREIGCLYAITESVSSAACESRVDDWASTKSATSAS